MSFRISKHLIYALIVLQLTACMVGPDYVRPKVTSPVEFKEVKGWKPAQPRDDIKLGKWWEIFNDPRLNELEEQVVKSNQSIAQAEAQFRQAEHAVLAAESNLFPVVTFGAQYNHFRAASGTSIAPAGTKSLVSNTLGLSWQALDIWGSVRRQIESNFDSAQASAATRQALILSTQSALAAYYFQLKILDKQKKLLDDNVVTYSKTLEITQNRYAVGVAAKSDVVQALAQLESIRAQAINLGIQRAQFEHAIAVLTGKPPAELTVEADPLNVELPPIPLVLPSVLLERRPDIAVAERQMAAANAMIGVAKAAYFPVFNMNSQYGFQQTSPLNLNTLYSKAFNFWAIGAASLAMTLLDGGSRNAQYKQSIDAFDASVANYRQVVLTAFQQVEDNLAALRILDEEIPVQNKAVAAAEEAVGLTINQYKAGTVTYINVMTALSNHLNYQLTAVQLLGSRLTASVQLVTALGGGWNMKMVPSSKQIGDEIKWTDYLVIPGVDQGRSENAPSTIVDDFMQFHVLP